MRTLRRLLLVAGNIGVGTAGFLTVFLFAIWFNPNLNSPSAFFAALLTGLLLTAGVLRLLNRLAGPVNVAEELAIWIKDETERRQNPVRRRRRRIAFRILIWMPSAAAGFLLLFFPVATHLVHPGSHYLPHYRVPIPWNFMTLPAELTAESRTYYVIGSRTGIGRYGVSPAHLLLPPLYVWQERQLSVMTFTSYGMYSIEATVDDAKKRGVDLDALQRKFNLSGIEVTCWQYRPYWSPARTGWQVFCRTTRNVPRNDFSATFDGRQEELESFYEIVGGTVPLDRAGTQNE